MNTKQIHFMRLNLIMLMSLITQAVFAAMTITTQTPTINDIDALASSDIAVTFSEDMASGTVTTSQFIVTGSISGVHSGTFTKAGNTVTFNPTQDFAPGETVTVTLTTGLQSTAAAILAAPQTWQFTVKSPIAPANFTDSGQSLGSSSSFSVTLGDLDGDGDLDAWVANTDSQANRVWLNDGSGTFTDSGQSLGSSSSRSVTLGDFDGDGDLDAWVANTGSQANRVWLNSPANSVTLTESGGSTAITEGGATDNYDLKLDTAPTANVTLSISPDSQCTVSPTPLTFTTSNWSTVQTVTVTANDDSSVEGSHSCVITHSASGGGYDSVSIANVTASVTDNDMPAGLTGLTATGVAKTQINLSWTDNSSNETGFKLERDSSLITTTAANATSYSDTGLTCGTTYNYVVVATNVAGDSPAATTSGATLVCNNTPTAADQTVATNEDTDKTFVASEFNFSDADSDSLAKIQITQLPTQGRLYLDANSNGNVDSGEVIGLNQDINASDIAKLIFKPVANDNGTSYTTFQFKVHDGALYSALAYTMTINVTAINDAPAFTSTAATSVNEGNAYSYRCDTFS